MKLFWGLAPKFAPKFHTTMRNDITEYDLHPRGARVDDAVARLNRIVAAERNGGAGLFAVITGYGSSGGTAMIKNAVLAACMKYKRQNHIRGFLDGEYAGDIKKDLVTQFNEVKNRYLNAYNDNPKVYRKN